MVERKYVFCNKCNNTTFKLVGIVDGAIIECAECGHRGHKVEIEWIA